MNSFYLKTSPFQMDELRAHISTMIDRLHPTLMTIFLAMMIPTALFCNPCTSSSKCPSATLTSPCTTESPCVQQLPINPAPHYNGYGTHYPHGLAAVTYIYGSDGTYKNYTCLQNIYAYYGSWGGAVPNQHPTSNSSEINTLIGYANGTEATSTPDANDHALFNLKNCEQKQLSTGYQSSFHEHNARGPGNVKNGNPFTQFWFDDNWLSRYMSIAYGAPLPMGLWATQDFNRWQILEMNPTNWVKYPDANNLDELILNSLYDMTQNNYVEAKSNWDTILTSAGNTYDPNNQRYTYPNIKAEYYLGLFAILTQKLMDSGHYSADVTTQLVQHFISLRSNILSDQQYENGTPIGWLSGDDTSRTASNTLINTETTAANVLALGSGAQYCFEAGFSPLQTGTGNYYVRNNYFALSAVVELSSEGYMSRGPNWSFPPGHYIADFYLRCPNPETAGTDRVANVDIYDATEEITLASKTIHGSEMQTSNQWTRVSVPFDATSHELEFRVYWHGKVNLDVSAIRIR